MYGPIVVFLRAAVVIKNSLRDFFSHIAVSSLGRSRSDFLMIEQKNHLDLRIVSELMIHF